MSSYNKLKYRHISLAAEDILDYIQKRRTGEMKSLKTRWSKFNNMCMGGIEPNTIYTVAGISGSGKSSFVNSLESDLFDNNQDQNFVVLNFNMEMVGAKQIGRKLSYKMTRTTSDLYSTETALPEYEYLKVKQLAEEIKKYPIYYVDVSGNVDEIRQTILHFMENEGKDKWVVIIIDHVLLTKGRQGEDERQKLANLQYMLMEIKKYNQNTIIQLSQLNRDIESTERISNQSMHFPMRKDVFGSEAIYQASDYVIVLHRPQLLQIQEYGIHGWKTEGRVYVHLLKNRDGAPGIIVFIDNLEYNRLDEADASFAKNENKDALTIEF